MSELLEYGKIYFCHPCRKYVGKTFADSHVALGHKVDSYITMPRKAETEKEDANDAVEF